MHFERGFRSKREALAVREQFLALRQSALVVQKHRRMTVVRKRFLNLKDATLRIQGAFRRYRMRKLLKVLRKKCLAATSIQSWFRGNRLRSRLAQVKPDERRGQQRERDDGRRVPDLVVRSSTPQSVGRKEKLPSDKADENLLVISAVRLAEIRSRLEHATKNVTAENTLGARCQKAFAMLEELHARGDLTRMKDALIELERLTSQSMEICVVLVEKGVLGIAYDCLRQMNRSMACLQAYPHAARVLLNLAKYEKTAGAVCAPADWLDCVMWLLSASFGHDSRLFVEACLLLVALSHVASVQLQFTKSERSELQRLKFYHKKFEQSHHCWKELSKPSKSAVADTSSLSVEVKQKRLNELAKDMSRSPICPAFYLDRLRAEEWLAPKQALELLLKRLLGEHWQGKLK